jgi:hypothetical protein
MDTHRKKGFSSPIDTWLQRGLSKAGKSLLLEGSLCCRGFINPQTVQTSYSDLGANIQLLLVGAELWARRWIEGDTKAVTYFSVNVMRSLLPGNSN